MKRYGDVRAVVHTTLLGQRVVWAGNRVLRQHTFRPWVTFHEFLIDYVKDCFGDAWRSAEAAKAPVDRHPIYAMFDRIESFGRALHGTKIPAIGKALWTGDMGSILTLAYDLFVVEDNASLPNSLVERLRRGDQYQGARHELFAIATCVRAGFGIEYEDETDNSRRHPEFVATYRKTGLAVAVEAKSRHRQGVLGFSSPTARPPSIAEQYRAGIHNLLVDAVDKSPNKPYVVFVDVNLPDSPEIGPGGPPWGYEVDQQTLSVLPVAQRRKLNLVLCTNITFHRSGPAHPHGIYFVGVHHCETPEFPIARDVLRTLEEATQLFQNVPHEFPGEPLT
jgi:hypothetical protein